MSNFMFHTVMMLATSEGHAVSLIVVEPSIQLLLKASSSLPLYLLALYLNIYTKWSCGIQETIVTAIFAKHMGVRPLKA
jgi:hypothetical protein